jgi:hypothetical protein
MDAYLDVHLGKLVEFDLVGQRAVWTVGLSEQRSGNDLVERLVPQTVVGLVECLVDL